MICRTALAILGVAMVVCGELNAAVVFSDTFEFEPLPPHPPGYIANYDGFANWDILGSGVDLTGPGPNPPMLTSIMVDLDGTSGSTLITKDAFTLVPGDYVLTFDLMGPVGGEVLDTVLVQLGSLFSESITVRRGDPIMTFLRTFPVTDLSVGPLSFTDLGADSNGAYLDNVRLDRLDNAPVVPEPSAIAIWMMLCVAGSAYRSRLARRPPIVDN